MAHGDYDCCACCDCKMAYNAEDPTTKETLCSACVAGLSIAAARPIDSGAALVKWFALDPIRCRDALSANGYQSCIYHNPVDEAVGSLALHLPKEVPAND